MKKQSLIAGAMLLGSLSLSANEPENLSRGILVSKEARTALVRDCATEQLVTVQYGSDDAFTFLIGETVGFIYDRQAGDGIMMVHYPDMVGCGHYHS